MDSMSDMSGMERLRQPPSEFMNNYVSDMGDMTDQQAYQMVIEQSLKDARTTEERDKAKD